MSFSTTIHLPKIACCDIVMLLYGGGVFLFLNNFMSVCGCVYVCVGVCVYSKKDPCTLCMVAEARRFPSSYRDCFKGHNQLTVFLYLS